MASPQAMGPLFRDTVPVASAAHDTSTGFSAEESTAMHGETHWPAVSARPAAAPYSSSEASDEDRLPEYSAVPSAAAMLDEDQPAMIPLAERERQLARLEYLCQCLRDARQPLCPLNGAIALLPLGTIGAGPREVVELQKAVKGDLASIQNELKLRFPVTALAVGMEADRGFEELIRRVGPERAKSQRFGHRFDVRAVAAPSQLAALCARISGVFEDWVYAIFRERGSVSRAGNSQLFGLLCKVRTQLQDRLVRILCGGFGHDPERANRGEPVAFSGCYFAATGRTDDSRAFVEGVFNKLDEEQDNVEWTKEALREGRRFRRIGWLGLLVIAACGIAWVAGHFLRQT
jgi:type VI protein secretion system component VasK